MTKNDTTKKDKNIRNTVEPWPHLDHQAPVICSDFPHVSSALVMRIQLQTLQEGDTQFTTCRKYRIQHQNMGFGTSPLKFSMKEILYYFRHADSLIFGQIHDTNLTLYVKQVMEAIPRTFSLHTETKEHIYSCLCLWLDNIHNNNSLNLNIFTCISLPWQHCKWSYVKTFLKHCHCQSWRFFMHDFLCSFRCHITRRETSSSCGKNHINIFFISPLFQDTLKLSNQLILLHSPCTNLHPNYKEFTLHQTLSLY